MHTLNPTERDTLTKAITRRLRDADDRRAHELEQMLSAVRNDNAQVTYFTEPSRKFTTALLKTNQGTLIGAAKRATHPDMADDFDPEVGKQIALSRTIDAQEL